MDFDRVSRWQQPISLRPRGAVERRVGAAYAKTLRRWPSVTRWSIFGPAACLLAAWALTLSVFAGADLSPELWQRLAIAATAGPLLIAVPMFYSFSKRMRRLALENRRLSRVANIDSLTGCLNRGAFTELTEEFIADPKNTDGGALLVIDADNFKVINDAYGHDQGDLALTIIADTIRKIVRTGALVGRLGGEEFGVYLPSSNRISAYLVAERIRRGIRKASFMPKGHPHQLGVSIGGAVYASPTSFKELFRCADQGLYTAKKAGRNRVEVAAISLPQPLRTSA